MAWQTSAWAFPQDAVVVDRSETGVLGAGAYGEVRVARWSGSLVAAKQLHAFNNNAAEGGAGSANVPAGGLDYDPDALVREMSVLSELRHPNLVLFLGVTFDPATSVPCSILTELLPHSLYDVLEVERVKLEEAEVLGLATDVCQALVYLHGRSPAVVHRDLSARNVLLDAQGRAKLADLGQAKVLGGHGHSHSHSHSNSQSASHSAMPGAMAYAAPEVLTGR